MGARGPSILELTGFRSRESLESNHYTYHSSDSETVALIEQYRRKRASQPGKRIEPVELLMERSDTKNQTSIRKIQKIILEAPEAEIETCLPIPFPFLQEKDPNLYHPLFGLDPEVGGYEEDINEFLDELVNKKKVKNQ
jgi:hypothetical protein